MSTVLTTTTWFAAAVFLLSIGVAAESKAQPMLDANVRVTDGPVVRNTRDAAGILAFKGIEAATPWSLATDPGVTSYGPVVDGYVLPDEPTRIFVQGKQNDVALMVGWNAHEGGPFRSRALPHKGAATFIGAARERYGVAAMSAFVSLYPAATDAEATNSAFRLSGDEVIGFPAWWWVDLQARTGRAPAHGYHFTKSSL